MKKKYKVEKSKESLNLTPKDLMNNPLIKHTTENLVEKVLDEQLGIKNKKTKGYKELKEKIIKKLMKHPSYKKIMIRILDIFKDF